MSGSICPARGAVDEIGGKRFQRIARPAAWLLARLEAPRRRRRPVAAAVGNRPQQRQAIEALLAQEVRGVAVLFLQQEHEQRAAVHLLRARRSGVHHGAFDDPIEANGRLGLHGFLARHGRERLGQHFFELAAELCQIDAARAEQLARLRILDERVQHVFESDEIVPSIGREAEGTPDALERLRRERNGGVAHARCSSGSGSIVTSSGNSCCSARRLVAVTFVSATSRV